MHISTDNPDLFRAILAMDAYNRGYNSGIGGTNTGLRDSGSGIGAATVGSNSSILGTGVDQASSFFAQAYSWNGKTVIAFRGTDNPLADAATGWATGGGAVEGSQALRAEPDLIESRGIPKLRVK